MNLRAWRALSAALALSCLPAGAVADESFAAFGVPRSDLLDTPTIYPLASGTIPRPGIGSSARRSFPGDPTARRIPVLGLRRRFHHRFHPH